MCTFVTGLQQCRSKGGVGLFCGISCQHGDVDDAVGTGVGVQASLA
jgi:hypothetical protein